LHKLHLPVAQRYSDDLDYVRRTKSPIGPSLDALRNVAENMGLATGRRESSGQMVHIHFGADASRDQGRITVRVETNISETEPYMEHVSLPYSVVSPWWSGSAEVLTFSIEELMSTKLRALYQRRKGRDLFDLWYVLTTLDPNLSQVVNGLHHYMTDQTFSYRAFADNLADKIKQRGFRSDLEGLVMQVPKDYSVDAAADLVMDRVGVRLKGAPGFDELAGGRWRQ